MSDRSLKSDHPKDSIEMDETRTSKIESLLFPRGFLFQTAALLTAVNAFLFIVTVSKPAGFFLMVKWVYNANTLVAPIILLAWCGGGFILIRDRRKITPIIAVIVYALCMLLLRVYATHIEPYRLLTIEHTIATPKIHSTSPLRILHVTDIQSMNSGAYEQRVFDRVNELNPDLILFTGDLIQPRRLEDFPIEIEKMERLLAQWNPPLGVYGVEGNVDTWMERGANPSIRGIHWLNGESVELTSHGTTLSLMGLTWRQSHRGSIERIEQWFEAAPPNAITILMGHDPAFAYDALDLPIDLCLAGHVHGGQIVIPGYGPPVTFSAIPRAWARGFRPVGKTWLNVSAGVGCEHAAGAPMLRVFCPPDVTVFTFSPGGSNTLAER
ncbi:MAG: hypothetical protein GC154_16230 [bacterium]|nr:hypothetical protein [bacterium]